MNRRERAKRIRGFPHRAKNCYAIETKGSNPLDVFRHDSTERENRRALGRRTRVQQGAERLADLGVWTIIMLGDRAKYRAEENRIKMAERRLQHGQIVTGASDEAWDRGRRRPQMLRAAEGVRGPIIPPMPPAQSELLHQLVMLVQDEARMPLFRHVPQPVL